MPLFPSNQVMKRKAREKDPVPFDREAAVLSAENKMKKMGLRHAPVAGWTALPPEAPLHSPFRFIPQYDFKTRTVTHWQWGHRYDQNSKKAMSESR